MLQMLCGRHVLCPVLCMATQHLKHLVFVFMHLNAI